MTRRSRAAASTARGLRYGGLAAVVGRRSGATVGESGSGRGVAVAFGLFAGLGLAVLALLVVAAIGGGVWYVLSASDPANVVGAAPVVADEEPVVEEPVEPAPALPDAPEASPEEAPAAPPPSSGRAPAPPAPPAVSKPAPAPAPPPAGGGDVKVLSTPLGATVKIDEVERGRTPLKIPLDAGSHTIVVTLGKSVGSFTRTVAGDGKWCFVESGKKIVDGPCP